jgi:hypothetical protein
MSTKEYGQTSSTLWGPTLLTTSRTDAAPAQGCQDDDGAVEVSVHTLPKPLHREFHHVFSSVVEDFPESGTAEVLALPTNQRAREDLVGTGEKVEQEKDRLLNVFISFARTLCNKIRDAGYWADFIDPCSGLPMLTLNCNKVYSEVDGMECCLGYKSYNAGFCKILVHPVWGSAVYPATIFAAAPRKFVLDLIKEYPMLDDEKK